VSYDIYALQVMPGEANSETLDAILARETATDTMTPLDPAKEARKRSIATALATAGRGFDIVEHDYDEVADEHDITQEEARRRLRHVRCDNGTSRVELEDEHAAVKVPYTSALEADEVAEDVFTVLRVLHEEARLVPYDPQVGREIALDAEADRTAFLEAYRRGVEEARREGAEDPVTPRATGRWWRRLFGGG
jgi:hypothetical protein